MLTRGNELSLTGSPGVAVFVRGSRKQGERKETAHRW